MSLKIEIDNQQYWSLLDSYDVIMYKHPRAGSKTGQKEILALANKILGSWNRASYLYNQIIDSLHPDEEKPYFKIEHIADCLTHLKAQEGLYEKFLSLNIIKKTHVLLHWHKTRELSNKILDFIKHDGYGDDGLKEIGFTVVGALSKI